MAGKYRFWFSLYRAGDGAAEKDGLESPVVPGRYRRFLLSGKEKDLEESGVSEDFLVY